MVIIQTTVIKVFGSRALNDTAADCEVVLFPYKKTNGVTSEGACIYTRLDKSGIKLELEQYSCKTINEHVRALPKLTKNLDDLPLEIGIKR